MDRLGSSGVDVDSDNDLEDVDVQFKWFAEIHGRAVVHAIDLNTKPLHYNKPCIEHCTCHTLQRFLHLIILFSEIGFCMASCSYIYIYVYMYISVTKMVALIIDIRS